MTISQRREVERSVDHVLSEFWGQERYTQLQKNLLVGLLAHLVTIVFRVLRFRVVGFGVMVMMLLTNKKLPQLPKSGEIFVFAPTVTNRRVVDRVLGLVAHEVQSINMNFRRAKFLDRLKSLRYLRIVHPEKGVHDFAYFQMLMGRVALAYFARHFIDNAKHPSGVVLANDHSPISVALGYWAKASGIPLVYIQHAPINANYPKLIADFSVLFDEATVAIYSRSEAIEGDFAILPPFSEAQRDLRHVKVPAVWGLVLSRVPDKANTTNLIQKILTKFSDAKILVRPHPASPNVDAFLLDKERVSPHLGDLRDFADCVDIAICPGSGAIIELLNAGVRVAYNSHLDTIGFDPHGLVSAELVFDGTSTPLGDLAAKTTLFYNDAWVRRFAQRVSGLDEHSVSQQEVVVRKKLLETLGLLS